MLINLGGDTIALAKLGLFLGEAEGYLPVIAA